MGTFLSFRVYNTDNQPMIDTGASEIRLNSINPPSIANNSINDDIKKYMFLKQVWRNINQLQYGKTFLIELYL